MSAPATVDDRVVENALDHVAAEIAAAAPRLSSDQADALGAIFRGGAR